MSQNLSQNPSLYSHTQVFHRIVFSFSRDIITQMRTPTIYDHGNDNNIQLRASRSNISFIIILYDGNKIIARNSHNSYSVIN